MNLADRWHSAILKNSLDLMRYEAGLRTEILAMLTQLGRDLVGELAQAGLDTPRTDWQRARLRAMIEGVQKRVETGYGDIADHHALNLADAAEASANSLVVALNDAVGVELLQGVKWTPQTLKALVDRTLVEGAPSADWWARQSVDLQEAFADQMRQGVLRGEAIGPLTARVRDLMGVGTRNAEALVRTSALAVNNAAQLAAYQENADIIDKLQWTATLDPRTCLVAGTPVSTPSGAVPVESLTVGAEVVGGSGVPRRVADTMGRQTRKTLKVTLSNGETIRCTPDHQWLLDGQKWVEAQSLKAGDVLASALK